jgi:hypothetical protein
MDINHHTHLKYFFTNCENKVPWVGISIRSLISQPDGFLAFLLVAVLPSVTGSGVTYSSERVNLYYYHV